ALNPEVLERPVRRTFPAEYKRRLLEEADRCTEPGQLGALLRREGLYSSHLSLWREPPATSPPDRSVPSALVSNDKARSFPTDPIAAPPNWPHGRRAASALPHA